jgi:hypothetical protein
MMLAASLGTVQEVPVRGREAHAVMRLVSVAILSLVVAACSGTGSTPSPAAGQSGGGQPAASASGGGGTAGGANAAEALSKVKDTCSLMPQDIVKQVLPKAAAPAPEPEPFKCSMGDGNGVVEISVDANSLTKLETLNPCQPVSGVGLSACLQEQQPDDAYLQVLVGSASSDAILYVEVAGHDGKSHKDDAINVAKAILAKVQG